MRVITLKDQFMKDKTINDIIYGYLQLHSYLKQDKNGIQYNTRYVYKDDLSINKLQEYFRQNVHKCNISLSTLKRVISKLIQNNLLQQSIINNKDAYIIPYQTRYFVQIKTDVLEYLTNTANRNVIKIYIYLKARYNYKYPDKYLFSKRQLLSAIGYKSLSTDNYRMIGDILLCLSNNQLIRCHQEYTKANNSFNKTKYYVLDEVNDSYKCNRNKKSGSNQSILVPANVQEDKYRFVQNVDEVDFIF